jgi:hypothetical protein
MDAIALGVTDAGHELYVAQLRTFAAWPDELKLRSPHYALLVAADGTSVARGVLERVADLALSQGAVYACAWGPGAERVHDVFDARREVVLKPPPTEDDVVMTTWHDDETLEETVEFFVNAMPTESYVESCRSRLAVSVGSDAWAGRIRDTLEQFVRPT